MIRSWQIHSNICYYFKIIIIFGKERSRREGKGKEEERKRKEAKKDVRKKE
jgi:hypothetical protein